MRNKNNNNNKIHQQQYWILRFHKLEIEHSASEMEDDTQNIKPYNFAYEILVGFHAIECGFSFQFTKKKNGLRIGFGFLQ